jgi:ribokinase
MSARGRPPRVAVVGSLNLDLVARCESLPRPGETVGGAALDRFPGGKGANQAVAAARLGAVVEMIGAVGADPEGEALVAALERANVDAAKVATVDAPTGTALVLVDERGETEIVVAPGANARLHERLVEPGPHDAVLCQLEIPVPAVAAAARRCSGLLCLNAAPAPTAPLPDDLLERVDLLVVNRHELAAVRPAPRTLVAVTLGSEGAVLTRGGEELARARPPEVEAVDGTAAGDAFAACLLVSLLEGLEPGSALERACAAGALAASRLGAQPSLPSAREVDALLERQRRGRL